jgi:SAM-dependent methyltransferase
MNQATAFYDVFGKKLCNDYAGGNPRMLMALDFMRREMAVSLARRVLDIGCGIGWSSHELARIKTVEAVKAIDLSPALVATASRLFASSKISFEVVDVTAMPASAGGGYDAIVMLDVYEHIPKAARPAFHSALNSLIAKTGFILLTCPTIEHQNSLRENNPGGLQPVDEDVGLAELQTLASDIDGCVDYYKVHSIWNPRDYFHAVVRRRSGQPASPKSRRRWFETIKAKARLRIRNHNA